MNRVILGERELYSGDLILVRKGNPVRRETPKRDLIPFCKAYPDILLKSTAAVKLSALLTAIGCADEIVPVSGYRSRQEQLEIFQESLKENGEAYTRSYVAEAGDSEHETGLAIDLGENREEIDFIAPAFPDEGMCGAFRAQATKFGFIERYKEEKEHVTGISYEPWHFRYVGSPHAEIMDSEGMCLEEYLTYLKRFRYGSSSLPWKNGLACRIAYVPAEGEETELLVPGDSPYSLSGNNEDGFILTLFESSI